MTIKIQNTLSKQKEPFTPIKQGLVSMYNCGPTVYDRAHIGNLRSYVFADIIRRTFEYAGYKVHQVINITDIGHLSGDGDEGEDKMNKGLKREGLPVSLESMLQMGTKYMELFKSDLQAMNVLPAQEFPRASENIKEDIELIGELDKKGISYKTSDGVYFDTSKFPEYGKLGNIKLSAQIAGDRIQVSSEKRNIADFALWKFNERFGWESPWGKGFPGWHIECSAMSRKYLGQPFDIHTGGVDHIPVHHNNEIAQSEAAYGAKLANYWMHNEFLTIHDGKMAKSEGNHMTLDTLKENMISPLAYRYWLLTAHYSSPVEFSYEALEASQKALIRLLRIVSEYPEGGTIVNSYKEKFESYIYDDFDTAKSVALVWELIRDASQSPADKRATILDFDKVLGLNMSQVKNVIADEIPEEINILAEAREEARKNKEWEKADAIRKVIEERGYEIKDVEGGFEVSNRD